MRPASRQAVLAGARKAAEEAGAQILTLGGKTGDTDEARVFGGREQRQGRHGMIRLLFAYGKGGAGKSQAPFGIGDRDDETAHLC